jgi:hypothetical protein
MRPDLGIDAKHRQKYAILQSIEENMRSKRRFPGYLESLKT